MAKEIKKENGTNGVNRFVALAFKRIFTKENKALKAFPLIQMLRILRLLSWTRFCFHVLTGLNCGLCRFLETLR